MKKMVLLLLLLMVTGWSGQVFAQINADTVSIRDLQFVTDPGTNDLSPFLGDTVVVRGLVMTSPRDLWVGARWSVYIVDPDNPTDPWNGFFVIQDDTVNNGVQTLLQFVEPGMICYFTGVVTEFNAYSQVNIFGTPFQPDPVIPVTVESAGNPLPAPVVLTAADLANKTVGEQWESMWVRIENPTIVNNNISGNWASINDGTGLTYLAEYFNWYRDRLSNGTVTWPSNGTTLIYVDGFTRDEAGSPGQVYNINPRDTSDVITPADTPPLIEQIQRSVAVPTPSDNVVVNANITDNFQVATATLNYSVNEGPFQQVAMTATGDSYSATIPAGADGDFVRYFITSEDNNGNRAMAPGDTSRATGSILFYDVREFGLTIRDLQDTRGYASDASGYRGYEVTIRGVVMTDSTDFLGDYWIQDAADMWSGIWVNDGTFTHTIGDEVEVTGTVEENFNVTRLNFISSSTVVNAGVGEYPPVVVTTGEVATGGVNAEAYESVLIRMENLTVTNPFPDAPSNFGEFTIDDGTGGVRVDDFASAFRGNLDTAYVQGAQLGFLQGFGYFSFGNAKILPRDTLDVADPVGIGDTENLPTVFELDQNYPNPFNPTTSIRYAVNKPGVYKLKIYNVMGQEIRTLVNGFQATSRYEIAWDGLNESGQPVSSGIYFYKLSGEGLSVAKKMVLLK